MEANIFTDDETFDLHWQHKKKDIPKNDEHFTITTNLTLNKTVLDIHNALPFHDSTYFVFAFGRNVFAVSMFILKVRGKIIFTEYCIRHEFVSAYVNVLYITSPSFLLSYSSDTCTNIRLSLCCVME